MTIRDMDFLRAVLFWISSYINGRKQKVVSKRKASPIGYIPICQFLRVQYLGRTDSLYISII